MRVLHLTTSFPIGGESVSGVFIERLADALSGEVDVEVLTPDCAVRVAAARRGYRVSTFRYAPKPWQRLAHEPGGIPVALRRNRLNLALLPGFIACMALATWRKSRSADVIHAHWSMTGAVAGLVGRLTGRPVVTTLRGSDAGRLRVSAAARLAMRLCLASSDATVAVGNAIEDNVKASFPRHAHKLRTIPNGVDDALFLNSPRTESRGVTLISIGSLIERKGLERSIEALSLVPSLLKADRPVTYLVVGDGVEKEKLRQAAARHGVREIVRFHGAVPHERIPELLGRADALLLPSRGEGRPNAVLEAMASGLPCLAFDIPGVNELVQDGVTGYLAAPFETADFARKLQRLIEDAEQRRTLGANGRDAIKRMNLTWGETAAQYAALYRRQVR